jgi:uncharacterized protein
MKIWRDTTSASSSPSVLEGECKPGDCSSDCAQFVASHRSSSTSCLLVNDRIDTFRSKVLQRIAPMHIQACHDDAWLVCNPVGSGEIAVLDAEAFSVFERFGSPITLGHVLETTQGVDTTSLENAVTLMYNTGLLSDTDRTSIIHEEQPPQTLQAWLHVTNACNLRCEYCYISKSSEHMAEDTSRQAVDALFRSALRQGFKRVRVKYAGGEASLYLHRVLALHTYASQLAEQHGIAFSAYIISNGVALSEHAIEQFKAHKIAVTISLDGIGAYHDQQRFFGNRQGSFKYVDRTISRLLASDVVPYINVTVSRRNLDGLPSLMSYILERDMPFALSYYRENACSAHLGDLQFTDDQMITGMREALRIIERMLPKRRLLGSLIDKADLQTPHNYTCSAGRNYLVIDQHGGIAKCHTEIHRTVTSVKEDDPLRIIQEDRSDFQNLPVEEKQGCNTCMWRYWCTGGCPLVTYRTTGRSDIRSPNCHVYQSLFPDVLRLEALRLLKYELPIIL